MKSDISRQTFDPKKHYKSVRMQQGRVQLDSDWNEQSDISIHRIETEALDLIGGCGGPMDAAAFGIIPDPTTLSAKEQARLNLNLIRLQPDDFLLTAGRYYVDGILCENESITSFQSQPDYPALSGYSHLPRAKGPSVPHYLAYLDVWQRSVIALDDSQIREIALGGPDTCTRLKTVWQVKLHLVASLNCITAFKEFLTARPPSNGTLSATTQSEALSQDPCIVSPGAGFRGLENQLYRVEIHEGGNNFSVTTPGAGTAVSDITGANQVEVTGAWNVGQAVEIFSGDTPTSLKTRTLAYITSKNQNPLTLNTKITNLTMADHPRLRAVDATFKWSRDNGSVVTAIERIVERDITVSHTGLDDVLGFAPGQWVEIIDDALELNGRPGQLAQIAEVDSARRLITLKSDPSPLASGSPDGVDAALHPKLRRWDGIGAVNADSTSASSGWLDVEDGVQVRFGSGNYSTGDYWVIPARTATADAQSGKIEWPLDQTSNPLALLAFGIHHRYCPLALLSLNSKGVFTLLDDCRHLFPPVTELTSLFYVSGDGQEAMPDLTHLDALLPLPQTLVVGVANGSWPVKGAKVRFLVEKGAGKVMPTGKAITGDGKTADPETGGDGLARCDWQIDSRTQSQQVKATLLDADDRPVHLPVVFTANLSVADQVAYNPGSCASLHDQKTVQKALDRLSTLLSLYYLSGDGQEVMPGEPLQPLRVLVANRCGPVEKATVLFAVISGEGTVSDLRVQTNDSGVAECTTWVLGGSAPYQELEATLDGDDAHPTAPPTTVRFSATLSTADQVSYDPAGCPELADTVTTVQDAIDALCKFKDKDPGIHITDVRTVDPDSHLGLAKEITAGVLARGLRILVDRPVAASTLDRATCFVTLELPFPVNGIDREIWGDPVIGFQPLILDAVVGTSAGEVDALERDRVASASVLWHPATNTRAWLEKTLFPRLKALGRGDRVLAHLTLKGNFIWAQGKPDLYLDGDTFAVRASPFSSSLPTSPVLRPQPVVDLQTTSGDDRRGGTFEMWFWLTNGCGVDKRRLDFGTLGEGQSAQQSFTVTNMTDSDFTLSSLEIDNGAFQLVSPKPPKVVPAGQSQEVIIEFRCGGEAQKGTLTIKTQPATSGDCGLISLIGRCLPFVPIETACMTAPDSLEFVRNEQKTATITNMGFIPKDDNPRFTVESVAVRNGPNSPFAVLTILPPSGVPLDPGESLEVTVIYKPRTIADGNDEDFLHFTANRNSLCKPIRLTGSRSRGPTPPIILVPGQPSNLSTGLADSDSSAKLKPGKRSKPKKAPSPKPKEDKGSKRKEVKGAKLKQSPKSKPKEVKSSKPKQVKLKPAQKPRKKAKP